MSRFWQSPQFQKGTVIGNAVITDDNTSAADVKTDGAEAQSLKDSTMREQLSEESELKCTCLQDSKKSVQHSCCCEQ